MRKVDLSMEENTKYLVIKKLVEEDGNKLRAAEKIGCTVRNINRLINGYKSYGKKSFSHGNKGRKPSHAFSAETIQLVVDLYINKYYDSNIEHFCELLSRIEKIKLSPSAARQILRQHQILSPMAHKSTRKALIKELESAKMAATSKKEKDQIQTSIVQLNEAHPRRPRCAYAGEMLQMDASMHMWFGGKVTHLHASIDDATGTITGAYFDEQETLNGYYRIFEQTLTNYGVPAMFLTDNRTVFNYSKKSSGQIENNTLTQFGYACQQFGVELRTSSVPQAKGRVERLFNTLQSRLPVELRLDGVTTIQEANEFLKDYIKRFNEKFALPFNNTKSVFEKQPSVYDINLTLARIYTRTIDSGHCFKYMNNYYIPINERGTRVYHLKGTKGSIIQALDGVMYCCINDVVYALEHIPERHQTSENFDAHHTEKKPRRVNIPAKSHPWRSESFYRYLRKEEKKWKRFAS